MTGIVAEWLHPPTNELREAVTLVARHRNQNQSMLELGSSLLQAVFDPRGGWLDLPAELKALVRHGQQATFQGSRVRAELGANAGISLVDANKIPGLISRSDTCIKPFCDLAHIQWFNPTRAKVLLAT